MLPAAPIPPAPPGTRPVRDDDAAGLATLIAAAYAEYPGCVLDLPGIDADLVAPATTATTTGGAWWVLDAVEAPGSDVAHGTGGLAATVGHGAVRDGLVELKRLYVARAARGQGIASALVAAVERSATAAGADTVELWSDTRFTDAHRLYTALGYTRTGASRELHDPSETTEWRFVRRVGDTPGS